MTTLSRDELGLTWIGGSPEGSAADEAAAVFREVLPVPGGSVWIDVRDPRQLYAVIDDHDAAGWWVEQLFGPDIADFVMSDGHDASVDVADSTSMLYADSSRLLELAWLRRWWTAPITADREWTIDAQLGQLAWKCEDLLGDLRLASAFLEPAPVREKLAAYLLDVARRGGAIDLGADPVATVLHESARAALDSTAVDPAHSVLRRAYSMVGQVEDELRAEVDKLIMSLRSTLETASASLHEREAVLAAMDVRKPGEAARSDATDAASRFPLWIDPRAVHPRSLDYRRDDPTGVVDVVMEGESQVVTITLPTVRATFTDPRDVLVADVVLNDERHTATFERADGENLVATVRVSGTARPDVAVRSLLHDHSGRPDLRHLSAADVRGALEQYRLARASLPHSGRFVFERATSAD
ncbi:MAG: hypothetical protein RJQ01_10185 [Microcella sp.]|uniref:hypothetical protein n=1 Tax=Microcella sp. TaxID=1913979 RepID=UPI003315E8BF